MKNLISLALLAATLAILTASPVSATSYTVKSGGGGSFTTIQACATTAVAGDTCTIFAGTYNETVTPANSGTSGNPITFQTNASDAVTVTEWSLASGATYLVIEGSSATHMKVPSGVVINDHATHNVFEYIDTTGGGCWGGNGWYASSVATSFNQFLNFTVNGCGGTPAGAALEFEGNNNIIDGMVCQYAQACITLSGQFNVIRNSTFGPTSAAVLGGQHSQPIEASVSCGADISGGLQHLLVENINSTQWRGGDSHATILDTDTSPNNGCGSTSNVIRLSEGMESGSYSMQAQTAQKLYFDFDSFSNTQVDASPKDKEDLQLDPNASGGGVLNSILSNMTQVGSTDWCLFLDAGYVENHNLCFATGVSTWVGPVANSSSNTYDASDIFNSDPKFVNPASDLHLQANSPAIGMGGPLTTAVGSGTNSTSLTVVDANHFFADASMPGSNYQADWIRIGASTTVQISSINYSTNVIALASPESWSNGTAIYLYKNSNGTVVLNGSNPNIGFDQGTPLPPAAPLNLRPTVMEGRLRISRTERIGD